MCRSLTYVELLVSKVSYSFLQKLLVSNLSLDQSVSHIFFKLLNVYFIQNS